MSFLLRLVPAAIFAAGVAGSASAETLKIAPEQPLQAALDQAHDGDVIELAPGEHKGAIRIDRRLLLTGQPGAVLVGGGAGNVVTVNSPDVTIRGVIRAGTTMMAILEGPNKQSFTIRPKDRLFDATVVAVDADGVVFSQQAEGLGASQVRKSLRPAGEGIQ